MTEFNKLQTVKRRFFAMRNGVVADVLRKGGSPFRIIFGMNLPQLVEMATEIGCDAELAGQLWRNVSTRESMLLAPMLFDAEAVDCDRAAAMAAESPSAEVADVLCHRLLRRMPGAYDLACRLAGAEDDEMSRYCAMRLLWHHIGGEHRDEVEAIAKAEMQSGSRLTGGPARQIVEEIEFLKGE